MTSREGGDICEIDAPFLFDVRAAARTVVGIGVRVPAKPEVNGSVMFRQIILKRLRIGLAIDPIEIGSSFRAALADNSRDSLASKRPLCF